MCYRHYGPLDIPKRFNHNECTEYGQSSNDKRGRLYVTRKPNGWQFHCHNCGDKFSGFQPRDGASSPSETIEAIKNLVENELVTADEVKLPPDCTDRLHKDGVRWLLKYGITSEEISKYKIVYSPSIHRLIFPVFDSNDNLVAWQGRALDNSKIKYMTEIRKDIEHRVYYVPKDDRKSIVIVEDIVSAIKVGRHLNAMALLGSYFNPKIVPYLRCFEKVIFWLDDDKYVSSISYAKKCRQLGLNACTVRTIADPKACSDKQIKNLTK
jgi:hypothetical protein